MSRDRFASAERALILAFVLLSAAHAFDMPASAIMILASACWFATSAVRAVGAWIGR